MKRKHKRLIFVAVGMAALGLATLLVLSAFRDSLVFFYSPSDLRTHPAAVGRVIRLGGLVEQGSFQKGSDGAVSFRVTDLSQAVPVTYKGLLPDLFREGQGVVVEGRMDPDGRFAAAEVLAKHDEKYMPPEVAEALKKSGHWQGEHKS